jgi:uncharacterized LabA/DUF88 family protein
MNKAIVFFDGKYLQLIGHYFKGQSDNLRYDLNQLAITLSKQQSLWCKKVLYYTAPPFQSDEPTENETRRRSEYDRFKNKLDKIPNFVVREGRCQKIGRKYCQKGVDTLVTMDLLSEAAANRGLTFILVACDTDFVPILKEIKEKFGIRVVLYYFTDRVRSSKFSMSNHILTACNTSVLMTKDMFLKSQFPRPEQLGE